MSLWLSLGTSILGKKHLISASVFKTFFKLTPRLVEIVWKRLSRSTEKSRLLVKPQHLLWTLHFLKSQNPLHEEVARVLGICKKTMTLHVTRTLRLLKKVCPQVFYNYFELHTQSLIFKNFLDLTS